LPPSTSGSISRPEITIGLSGFTASLPAASKRALTQLIPRIYIGSVEKTEVTPQSNNKRARGRVVHVKAASL